MSLASADVVAFEKAVRRRVAALIDAGIDRDGLKRVLKELEDSALPGFEIARRAGRLAVLLPNAAEPLLAEVAAESNREIRSALVGALPPRFQQSAYHPATSPQPGVSVGATVSELERDESAGELSDPLQGVKDDGNDEDWRAVLLLGGARESASNSRLLESRGMKAVRVSSLESLEGLLREPICGLVIYASWWSELDDPGSIVDFVRTRISCSNLIYTKIDLGQLGAAETPLAVLIEELDDQVKVRVNCSEGPGLTITDLRALEGIAASLETASQVHVGIEGIDDADRQLLAAAVAAFADAKHLPRRGTEERLSIRPLHEGRSGADVLMVRSEAFGLVVVAKLDELAALQDELSRARQAIPSTWLTAGDLCLYSLGGRGALLQRLLVDLDSPQDGAPSLRERLRECSAWERGRTGIPEPEVVELCQGVDRLVGKVVLLNRPAADEPSTLGWMDAKPLERLAGLNIHWQVGEPGGDFDPTVYLDRTREILRGHPTERVVHGDLHTGNALMLDTRTPDLIDFALAGSGHPCFDLVRVSSAIAYEFLRQLQDEGQMRSFFSRLHVDGAGESELKEEFAKLVTGAGPEVAVHALVTCRAAAVDVIDGDRADALLQYLAMVYLVAAQSLTIEGFQEGLVRSALAAVGPML